VFLTDIIFRNFRNYESLNLKFSPGVNLITGKNAQGKTNILEGIYFLSTAKSHRTNHDDELIQHGKQWFYLKGNVSYSKVDSQRISIPNPTSAVEVINTYGEKKRVRINGKPQDKISSLIGKINVVMFSPEDLSLIKGSPGERRRFLDILISRISPSYLLALQEYYSSLNQRNELLKNIRDKRATSDTLDSWDDLLVKSGSEILRQRFYMISELSQMAKEKHSQLTSGQEELGIEYKSEGNINSSDIEELFRKSLRGFVDSDIRRGLTSVGPHRDDLIFTIACLDTKKFCSQGQQRTSVLSLKLANMELMIKKLNEYPIILLDDVTSELDENRASFLFELLSNISAQTFVTATDFNNIPIRVPDCTSFIVEKGRVKSGTPEY